MESVNTCNSLYSGSSVQAQRAATCLKASVQDAGVYLIRVPLKGFRGSSDGGPTEVTYFLFQLGSKKVSMAQCVGHLTGFQEGWFLTS